jgi:hypothetical protein
MVSEFLDLEILLRRRFREESVSDLIVAAILKLGEADIRVIVPYEPETGSDFDLTIVDPYTSDAVQYRIQAKRLVPNDSNWEISSYRELDHPHGTGDQSRILMKSSAHEKIFTIPLYAFYNPNRICRASSSQIEGIELASGYQVRNAVRELIAARPKRLPNKRIGHLRKFFFPLTTILCPPPSKQASARRFPPPLDSRRQVEEAIELRAASISEQSQMTIEGPPQLRSLPPPDGSGTTTRARRESNPLPGLVLRALNSTDYSPPIRANVKRPKLILISREY